MQEGVALEESIENAIPCRTKSISQDVPTIVLGCHTSNLELRANAQSGTGGLGLANAFNDAGRIALKVQGPLVKGAKKSANIGL